LVLKTEMVNQILSMNKLHLVMPLLIEGKSLLD
jgi:hypothetical protein